MQILVVASHLDDEVIGMGGTIAHHVSLGDEVYVANLCLSAQNDTQMQDCASQVEKILGIRHYYICELPFGELQPNTYQAIRKLEKIVDELKPDIIYTHHLGDSHQDHRAAFHITISALRFNRGTKIASLNPRILSYEVLSSSERAPPFPETAFLPNSFVDISAHLEKKLAAVRIYITELGEFPHPRSVEGIKTLSKYRGMQAGVEAAEAFVVIREVVKDTSAD